MTSVSCCTRLSPSRSRRSARRTDRWHPTFGSLASDSPQIRDPVSRDPLDRMRAKPSSSLSLRSVDRWSRSTRRIYSEALRFKMPSFHTQGEKFGLPCDLFQTERGWRHEAIRRRNRTLCRWISSPSQSTRDFKKRHSVRFFLRSGGGEVKRRQKYEITGHLKGCDSS